MSNYGERQSLLSDPSSSPITNRSQKPPMDTGSMSSGEWSSSYSSGSSISDSAASDDSYIPDWEPFVREDGSLFYIEYDNHPLIAENHASSFTKHTSAKDGDNHRFNRSSTRRSKKTGNRLSRLIARGNTTIKPNQKSVPHQTAATTTADSTKVKFSEIAEGELKHISVFIDPAMRHKFGRRASVAEAILGVSVCPFPDSHDRIMIAGYMPNSTLGHDRFVKVGDWLKAIDDEEVTMANLDGRLLGYGVPTEIRLTLQRMSGEQQTVGAEGLSYNQATSWAEFVGNAKHIFGFKDPLMDESVEKHAKDEVVLSVMYLTMADLGESSAEGQDVLFCYPEKDLNCLYGTRGSFLTLNSLLRDMFGRAPLATTIEFSGVEYVVVYQQYDEDLMLIAFSSNHLDMSAAKSRASDFVRCMELLHQKLCLVLTNPANHSKWTHLFVLNSLILERHQNSNLLFECQLNQYAHYVPLPKEAQLRIDDALCEMEAMDYREWNDQPLKSHREFYIIGSALFYKRYLLASHLPPADLQDIEMYMRVHGLFELLERVSVRDLLVWQEVYPKSVERGTVQQNYTYGIPQGRWFLSLVARGQLCLAVVLESRHDNDVDRTYITPSPFYVEEIQDTFDHIKNGGIESLASTWIGSNKRPQTIKSTTHQSSAANADSSTTASTTSNVVPPKKAEIISILKRRHNSTDNVHATDEASSKLTPTSASFGAGSSSVNSQTFSEDSNHEGSDSDWDGFPDSHRSSSGFDMSELNETLLRDVSDVIPSQLTTGPENILYHYVQVDVGHGTFMASPNASPTEPIIQAFRRACISIHTVLQNTVKFRYMLTQDLSPPSNHRSLVAVKEHGILMSIDSACASNAPEEQFWVIGRLFEAPPQELYVCHRADVPQNLVELAFRLTLNAAG